MKLVKIGAIGLIGLLSVGLMISCTKSFDEKTVQQTDFSNTSQVRVFLATVNASRNYVYMDNNALTGAALASGSTFPSTSAYAASIPAGLRAFLIRDTLGTSMQVPLSFSTNMQVGKNYSIFVYDTISSPKQKTVETRFQIPTDTTVRIRFANFIYNPTIVPAVDVFLFSKNANIFTNVNVTDVTDFISYSIPVYTLPNTSDTMYIRETGTNVNIIKIALGGVFTQKRSYTLVYRGSHRGVRTASLYTDR